MTTQLTAFGRYLVEKEIPHIVAAKELDTTRSYIHALAVGNATPGLKLAVKIDGWTGGAVSWKAWVLA